MIILTDYYMGRDATHGAELTPALRRNAERTVGCANAVLDRFGERRRVSGGWRPRTINAMTKGADPESPHITCEGIDLEDGDGALKEWAIAHPADVIACGFVAIENPEKTPGWCHFQTRLPYPWQKGKNILIAAMDWRNKSGEEMLA